MLPTFNIKIYGFYPINRIFKTNNSKIFVFAYVYFMFFTLQNDPVTIKDAETSEEVETPIFMFTLIWRRFPF